MPEVGLVSEICLNQLLILCDKIISEPVAKPPSVGSKAPLDMGPGPAVFVRLPESRPVSRNLCLHATADPDAFKMNKFHCLGALHPTRVLLQASVLLQHLEIGNKEHCCKTASLRSYVSCYWL